MVGPQQAPRARVDRSSRGCGQQHGGLEEEGQDALRAEHQLLPCVLCCKGLCGPKLARGTRSRLALRVAALESWGPHLRGRLSLAPCSLMPAALVAR